MNPTYGSSASRRLMMMGLVLGAIEGATSSALYDQWRREHFDKNRDLDDALAVLCGEERKQKAAEKRARRKAKRAEEATA